MRLLAGERFEGRVWVGAGEGEPQVDGLAGRGCRGDRGQGRVGTRRAAPSHLCSSAPLLHDRQPDRVLRQPQRLPTAPDLEAGSGVELAGVLDEEEGELAVSPVQAGGRRVGLRWANGGPGGGPRRNQTGRCHGQGEHQAEGDDQRATI